jgi:hypothetical protein
LACGLAGFLLFSKAIKEQTLHYALIAGVALALGIMCHTAALFCLVAAIIYFPLAWIITKPEEKISFARFAWASLSLLLPLLLLTQVHSRLLASSTNQTNLLARVQLCRGGSYAFITPIESVFESCKKYYERQGVSGILADRVESLSKAFDFKPLQFLNALFETFYSETSLGDFLRSFNTPLLLVVPDSIGNFSLVFLIFFVGLYFLSIRFKVLLFSKSSLALPIGFLLLFAYSCMLGEYTEMSSHVVPYIITLLIHLGILMELSRLSKLAYLLYCLPGITLSCLILLARLGAI